MKGTRKTFAPPPPKGPPTESHLYIPLGRRDDLYEKIQAELDHAYEKHGRNQWGRHEFYAILLEEVDELWDAVKADEPQERVYEELKQVAAMCFRYYETQDKYRKPNE